MFRVVCSALCAVSFSLGISMGVALAGGSGYEPTRGPFLAALPAGAHAFFAEFRGRTDDDGFGHAYVALGAIDAAGRRRDTAIFGFIPKGPEDQHWGELAVPVEGIVGVSRSDLTVPPTVRFRVPLRRSDYYRVLQDLRVYQAEWTMYALIGRNCNDLMARVAAGLGLDVPLTGLLLPTTYVAEMKAINASRLSAALK